jgi:hypothetical protein
MRFEGGPNTLKNNLIVNNGVIRVNELSWGGLPLTSVNNTIVKNDGGYIVGSLMPGGVTMANDILWENGDDIDMTDVWGNPVADKQLISYCNISDGDLNGSNGNISVDPGFVGQVGAGSITAIQYDRQNCRTVLTDSAGNYTPGALARAFLWTSDTDTAFYVETNTRTEITVYGDVTQVASAGFDYSVIDYHLQPLSLCVDAGTNVGAPDHDFEGDPRPILGHTADTADMGADEYNPKPCTSIPIGDFNEDCKVDIDDFITFASHWLDCNLVIKEDCWK